MSEASGTLNGLIDIAERTLCCRQRITPGDFDDFSREVAALQPPVGVTLSDAPRNLVAVLMCFWQSPDAQRPLWMTAIAALLQLVRGDLSQIIEARRRPLEPEPNTTYRTGGGMPRDRYPSAGR
jgi:hypothetical protein